MVKAYHFGKEVRRAMQEPNKYKTARILAHLTIERAAEKTYISVSTIKRIERGTQPCSRDLAEVLADVYGAPYVADPTVPDSYTPKPRAEAMLKYLAERDDVERIMPRLRRILADGVIDDDEVAEATEAARELADEETANRDLRYAICG
jgi:transcriptional regulator with XRE-family HTH domain